MASGKDLEISWSMYSPQGKIKSLNLHQCLVNHKYVPVEQTLLYSVHDDFHGDTIYMSEAGSRCQE